MNNYRPLLRFSVSLLLVCGFAVCVYAQAPHILYKGLHVFNVNQAISPMKPDNPGGVVPPQVYGMVSNFAGNGKAGNADGAAIAASFDSPTDLTFDGNGNLYVTEKSNNDVRKITSDGFVSTFAGNRQPGSADGTESQAGFNAPAGILADVSGNLFVADKGNQKIRKISPNGVVETIAGNGTAGTDDGAIATATFDYPVGLAFDAASSLCITDRGNSIIRKITVTGQVSSYITVEPNKGGSDITGSHLAGILVGPSGNMYVADNTMIKKITLSGAMSVIAGSATPGFANGSGLAARFNGIYGLAMDKTGNLYVADAANNCIRKISPSGDVTTFAGSPKQGNNEGVGLSAGFNLPEGIVIGNTGNYLYVADAGNNLIREVSLAGYTINKPLPAGLSFDPKTGIISGIPTAVSPSTDYTITAYNADGSSSAVVNISVNDSQVTVGQPPAISYQSPQTYYVNKQIPPLVPKNSGGAVPANVYGLVTTLAGDRSQGSTNSGLLSSSFWSPSGVVFDAKGNLYISELGNNDIRKITPGGVVSTFAGTGKAGNIDGPVQSAQFNAPNQMAFNTAGNLLIADEGNNVIREINNTTGIVSRFAGTAVSGRSDGPALSATFNNPIGITITSDGTMYIADRGNSTIRKIDANGLVSTWLALGSGSAPAMSDQGLDFLASDAAGNIDFTYFNQVEQSTASKSVNNIAGAITPGYADGAGGGARFYDLVGIALDAGGDAYVADHWNNKIRRIGTDRRVTTVAGGLYAGYSDGVSSSANFNSPNGVTIDPTGDYLFVADGGNNLIRKVAITGYSIDHTLPTGLVFDPKTGIISGMPVFSTPADTYTVTAYNKWGSSSFSIIIQIDEATITFGPLPAKTVCDADFDPGAKGSGPITYTSTDAAVAIISSGLVHITGPGTTTITASDGISQVSHLLTVSGAVTPSIAISPSHISSCKDATVTFNATITNGGDKPAYQWMVNDVKSGVDGPQFTTATLNDGDQVTCILTSDAPCTTSPTATSNIAVFNTKAPVPTTVKITSSENAPFCAGTEVTFSAVASTPDVNPLYQWQINGNSVGSDSSVYITKNLHDGDVVTCLLISKGDCLVDSIATSNAITIVLNPASQCIVTIPSAFTPNGDGINDFWDISALVSYPLCTVDVFDRRGALVFQSVGYSIPWDGKSGGKSLPVGTYYYVIDLKNGRKPYAGPVTILR